MIGFEIQSPKALNFVPGQYLLASAMNNLEPLPAILRPYARKEDRILVEGIVPSRWLPGMELEVRGPLGRGFHIPGDARRIALVDARNGNGLPAILSDWIPAYLVRGGELTIFSAAPPAGLATAVEVLPLEQAGEAWKWADYLAADVDRERLDSFTSLMLDNPERRLPERAEVLVRADMPCGGPACCGLCAVKTAGGFRLACKDGPVFPLADLIREARR